MIDKKTSANYILSFGYWFGSRTQGLLVHPYITMREIMRERFLRPLTLVPTVLWILLWLAVFWLARLGLVLGLNTGWWVMPLGRVLVFGWIWSWIFLGLWQLLLLYLYVRFRLIQK